MIKSVHQYLWITGLLVLLFLTACSAIDPVEPSFQTKEIVESDDLATIIYTLKLDNGQIITRTADNMSQKIVAGKPGLIPGLAQSVLGMKAGTRKQAILEPDPAFGQHTAENIHKIPVETRLPRVIKFKTIEYEKKFKSLPQKGDLVKISPYFNSKIIDITTKTIVLENLPEDGFKKKSSFGSTLITVDGDVITVRLDAQIGAPLRIGKRTGKIVAADEQSYTVDFNHPFAGKSRFLEIEVLSLIKSSKFKNLKINWINDHDIGLHQAMEKKKNAVIVLYADWCNWCEKLFEETLSDPRITALNKDFVWIKANSDAEQSLKELYQQDSFPMIVLTGSNGRVAKKIDGYMEAENLAAELERFIATQR